MPCYPHPSYQSIQGAVSVKCFKHPAFLLPFFLFLSQGHAYATENKGPEKQPGKKSHAEPAWTYPKFLQAFQESGRGTGLTEKEFGRVQNRKKDVLQRIQSYLDRKFGAADPRILKAFQEVPREYFQYNYVKKEDLSSEAYEYPPVTRALGWGSALSDYMGQAYMVQLAHPGPKDSVLEIGTGSGFNIALLSRLVKQAYSIEIIEPLGDAVSEIFQPLGYPNVHTRTGDGYDGWEGVGKFDIILVTCAAQYVPPPLLEQLKPGGRLIIPIGQPFKGDQVLYVYRKDKQGKVHSKKNIRVYFIPMEGKVKEASRKQGSSSPSSKPTPFPRHDRTFRPIILQ